jgi:hypothetical protein
MPLLIQAKRIIQAARRDSTSFQLTPPKLSMPLDKFVWRTKLLKQKKHITNKKGARIPSNILLDNRVLAKVPSAKFVGVIVDEN